QRCFRAEAKRISMESAPSRHRGQQILRAFFIPNEIVVHHEDGIAPASTPQLVQFRQYLRDSLGARSPAVDCDDVAELAVKRAATRVLYGHRAVSVHEGKVRER